MKFKEDPNGPAKPVAWLRVSNISNSATGVFLANADGSAPDVQLRTERLEPLFLCRVEPVARLKTVPMKYRRMEFNAQLQQENAELRAAIDAMRGGGK